MESRCGAPGGSVVRSKGHLLDAKVTVSLVTEPWSKPKDKIGAGLSPAQCKAVPYPQALPRGKWRGSGGDDEMEMPCTHH